MREFFLLACFLALFASPAEAQKTKAQINTEISTNFPDNTSGLITPQVLRNTTADFVASWQQYAAVNAQTGTSYTVQLSDYGQLITTNNAGAVTVNLPQATGSFGTFNFYLTNLGAGTATLTPTTSTVCGAATKAVTQNSSIFVVSDGANYQCFGPFGAGGTGTVTSVGLSMPGIFTVSSSPITTSGTIAVTANGTSGGIPYFSSTSTLASSGVLTANLPVIGGGAGAAPALGTRSGNTTQFVTTTGALGAGNCVKIDASGNFVDNGSACSGTGAPGGANTQVQFNNVGVFGGSANLTWVSPALTVGVAASVTGQVVYANATAGAVTVQAPASVTSYNFNLPATAGVTNAPMLSQGGGSTAQTYSAITYPTSATSGGIPYFSSTTAISSSALLTLNGVMIGGGAGATPSSIAVGTSGQVLLGVTGGAPAFASLSQDCTVTNAGVLTCSKLTGVNFTVTGLTALRTFTFPDINATIPRVVASGAKALATSAISSAACTAAQTDTATGTLTTDAVEFTFSADPTGVTGYAPSTNGMLTILPYVTADTVNFKVCNNTTASITPGAVTINWRVVR